MQELATKIRIKCENNSILYKKQLFYGRKNDFYSNRTRWERMTFSITQILIHDACAIEKKTTKKTKDNFFNHEKCEKDEKHEKYLFVE